MSFCIRGQAAHSSSQSVASSFTGCNSLKPQPPQELAHRVFVVAYEHASGMVAMTAWQKLGESSQQVSEHGVYGGSTGISTARSCRTTRTSNVRERQRARAQRAHTASDPITNFIERP